MIYAAVIIAILVGSTYFGINQLLFPVHETIGLAGADTYIVNADQGSVLFIYPDYNKTHAKPQSVTYASADQFALYSQAMGVILATATKPQLETTDTESYIDRTSWIPNADYHGSIVIIGGPNVNAATFGYETSGQSPANLDQDANNYYFKNSTGRIQSTAMPKSQAGNGTQDAFVIEAFQDIYGRAIFIMYGYSFIGSLAATKFYKFQVLPNLASYTASYYIVKWSDAASGPSNSGFPDPGDDYTVLASGEATVSPATRAVAQLSNYVVYGYVAAIVLLVLGVDVSRKWFQFSVERR